MGDHAGCGRGLHQGGGRVRFGREDMASESDLRKNNLLPSKVGLRGRIM